MTGQATREKAAATRTRRWPAGEESAFPSLHPCPDGLARPGFRTIPGQPVRLARGPLILVRPGCAGSGLARRRSRSPGWRRRTLRPGRLAADHRDHPGRHRR